MWKIPEEEKVNYYAYVRDDERDDHDYTCDQCAFFSYGRCEALDKRVNAYDNACEEFEEVY